MTLDLLGLVVTIATVGGVVIALLQLRASQRDAQAARAAELSWQIYLQYESQEIRDARRAIEIVSHHEPVPRTSEEFGRRYTVGMSGELPATGAGAPDLTNYGTQIRRMLRFYHQVGILIEKGLIDPDFVFELLGAGLDTSRQGIELAVAWYQNYEASEWKEDLLLESSRYAQLQEPRRIYEYALRLCQNYNSWKIKRQSPGAPVE